MVEGDRGFILIITMIYVSVLIVLGTLILGVTVSEHRMAKAHGDVVKAYYIAEAGLEKAIYHITKMDAIISSSLKSKTWVMEQEDYDLLKPDAQGNFTVKTANLNPVDEVFVSEGEETKLYKRVYEITLRATGTYERAPVMLEAILYIDAYESAEKANKVEILSWRQVGSSWDED